MKWLINLMFGSCSLLLPLWSAAQSWKSFAPDNIVVTGTFLRGPVNGFAQIPKGGAPGTSSKKRPTFSELGIHHNNDYDFELAANWQNVTLYAGYQNIRLKGSTVLDKNLITHGIVIPAGSSINARLKFDWYRLGGKYNFYFWQNKLIIAPVLEMAILNFKYSIPNFITPRQFSQVTARVGLSGIYKFNKQFSFEVSVASSVPFLNLTIITAIGKINYTLVTKAHFSPIIFVGCGYTYINFEDHQEVTNHMRFKQPVLLGGLAIKF